jgi:hypothetical protein
MISQPLLSSTEGLTVHNDLNEFWGVLRAPPKLSLIEWADEHRHVARKTSASPGR